MSNNNYCRLCAEIKSCQDVIVINKDTLKILQCFQIEIDFDDNLPKTICSICYEQANSTYEFQQKIHRSQEILRSIFNNIKQIKEEYKDSTKDTIDEEIKNEIKENDIKDECDYKNFSDDERWSDSNDSEEEKPLVSKKKPATKLKNGIKKQKLTRKTKPNFKGNVEEWKGYIWRCSGCTEEFQSIKDLRKHFRSRHDQSEKPMEYICLDCPQTYTKYPLFRRHVQKHRDKYKYHCEICNKFFYLKFRYKTHMKYVHEPCEDEKYVCAVCGKEFKWPSSLENHKRYVHVPDEEKYKYECNICHKRVSSNSNLRMHKKVHNDVREHTCEHCGVAFRQQGNLKQHILHKHTDIKDHACHCTMCPKIFKTMYSLKRHQRVHFGGETYKCEQCQKEFRHKRALKRHTNIHAGIYPHPCEYCKKCFRGKSDLEVHLRQHTGERPYSCLECNHHFSNNSNFIKHLRGRHGLTNFSIANQRQYPFVNINN